MHFVEMARLADEVMDYDFARSVFLPLEATASTAVM